MSAIDRQYAREHIERAEDLIGAAERDSVAGDTDAATVHALLAVAALLRDLSQHLGTR